VPVTLPRYGQQRTISTHQASHDPPPGSIGGSFLQFPNHWDDITQTRTCFVPQPQNASAGPDAITDRALHFCVVDRTGDGRSAAPLAAKRYILTCSAGGIREVLSSLAPEGSGRRVSVECRTSLGDEHGGLDLLERIVHHGWPFVAMIDEE